MSENIRVLPMSSGSEFRKLVRFPWALYRHDPNWTPPLVHHRETLLTGHPAWDYLEGQHFGAWRRSTLLGIITALVNPLHNDYHREQTGWFGGFECYDDPDAARALLRTAETWCRQRGMVTLRGPVTFTIHDECGLLIEGFTPPPPVALSYNPPYYRKLIEGAGYTKVMDTYEIRWTHNSNFQASMERVHLLAAREQEHHDIRVAPAASQQLFDVFREIYNTCWADNWGFVPITQAEFDFQKDEMKPFITPKTTSMAYVGEKPVGFIVTVPDINAALRKAYPRPHIPDLISLLRTLWYWKMTATVREARVAVMGILPEYRTGRAAALLLNHQMTRLEQTYDAVTASWILESNTNLLSICKALGGEISRTYRYYQKPLAAGE